MPGFGICCLLEIVSTRELRFVARICRLANCLVVVVGCGGDTPNWEES